MRPASYRGDWLHVRINKAEREALEKYAFTHGAGVGKVSTFYREMLIKIALKGKGRSEGDGQGEIDAKPTG